MLPTGEKAHAEQPLVPPCKAVLIHRSDKQERKAQGLATADQTMCHHCYSPVTAGCHSHHIPAPWRHPRPNRPVQRTSTHSLCWTSPTDTQWVSRQDHHGLCYPPWIHITSGKGSSGPYSIWAFPGTSCPTPLQPHSVGTAAASRAALQMLGISTAPSAQKRQ